MDVPAPPQLRRAPLPSTKGLGTALVVLLAVQAVGGLLALLTLANRIAALRAIQDGRIVTQRQLDRADLTVGVINGLVGAVFVATIVVWCIWQHHAQRNAIDLSGGRLRFTPGWAVGWWFIPIANLWKPFGSMRELWKASHGPAWYSVRTWRALGWWWAAWLLSWVEYWSGSSGASLTVGTTSARAPLTVSDMLSRDTWHLFSGGARVIAAVLAILIVRSILRLQPAAEAARDAVPAVSAPIPAVVEGELPPPPAPPAVAPTVDDTRPGGDRALLVATIVVVAVAIVGGLAWASGDHFPEQATGPGGTPTAGATFDDHGVTFQYPVGWTNGPVQTTENGTPPTWQEGFTPAGALPVEIVIVTQYDLQFDASGVPADKLQQQIGGLVDQIAQQMGGQVTMGVTPARLGAFDGYTAVLHGTLDGSEVTMQFNVAFDGFTEYTVVCQSTDATTTTIAVGCSMIKSTFVFTGA